MVSPMASTLFSILVLLSQSITAQEYTYLKTKIPQPLSDLTSTTLSSKIYLFGGCNSPKGNEWITELGYFVCTNITGAGYAYDPEADVFTELASAPRPRYRHAAAAVGTKIWLVGGRDVMDNIIPEIDVYDTVTNKWSTPTSLPDEIAVSDNAAWSYGNILYFAGGYYSDYNATDAVYAIDTEGSLTTYRKLASLDTERGDVHAVLEGDYAYITGGLTHKDYWCKPHSSVERYDLKGDEWKVIDALNVPRGDKALVSLNGYIIAMGGETKTKCDAEPGEATKPLNDVEYLNTAEGIDSEWKNMTSLPDDRFRVVAAAYPPTDTVYVFGGQKYFDADCMCFATSDAVLSYVVPKGSLDGTPTSAGMGVVGFELGAVIVAAVVGLGLF